MGFDEFKRRRDEDQQKRERLASEIDGEWEILKGFVYQFAADGKSIDDHAFSWGVSPSGRPMLVLDYVSAMLYGGERVGAPPDYRVVFNRKPAGTGEEYPDDSPIPATTWQLTTDIVADTFVWRINNDDGRSSTKLADEIAEKLARYRIEYEAAYGRAS